ncbi:hypothetical protein CKF54_02465 [Psittacicella hinzii]|uniref:Conjugal transfer pilus assembly protein TraB n=1 Tax=Psittacicella hinzii TaxID=2028575 RepID=A0A3A1Y8P4_9GAMM|nr:TraB/VirB10 family protein [Psittacicella hinzii]RIY33686.1 hypothetical protein CKF54_02465 [Psittacicella hinzii]
MRRALFDKLTPRAKQRLVLSAVAIFLIGAIGFVVYEPSKPNLSPVSSEQQFKVLNTERLDDFTLASLSNTLDQQKLLIDNLQRQIQTLTEQLSQQTQALSASAPLSAGSPLSASSQNANGNLSDRGQASLAVPSQLDGQAEGQAGGQAAQHLQLWQDLWQELAFLTPEEQCARYYQFIQDYPHLRNLAFERLIQFNLEEWESGIKTNNAFNQQDFPRDPYGENVSSANDYTYSSPFGGHATQTSPATSAGLASPHTSNLGVGINESSTSYEGIGNVYEYPHWQGQDPYAVGNTYTSSGFPQRKLTIRSLSSNPANTSIAIPSGSVFTATLVTGVDAPTTDGAKADPYPVLVKLDNLDFLPNKYRSSLESCFALLSSYGDISSHRAFMRLQTLSCINNQGYIVEGEVKGYAVGDDGKLGIAGRLVSKQGSLIAKSLAVGFLEGVSGAFSRPDVVVAGYPGSVTNLGDAGLGGSLQGTARALDRVANFYLSLANKMFPLVEVQAGVKIDLVITSPINLTVSDKKINARPLQSQQLPTAVLGSSWQTLEAGNQ